MKFVFYVGGKKKKKQVIKAKTNEELMLVAKIAKCELTKNSILKDLDFSSSGKLMCTVKDKDFTMKELWSYLESKLKIDNNKKPDKQKSKKKKKSSVSGEKKKKSSKCKKKDKKDSSKKKKNKKSKPDTQTKVVSKKSNGLVHITRR